MSKHLMGVAPGVISGAFWRKGWRKDSQGYHLLVSNGSCVGAFSVCKMLHVVEPLPPNQFSKILEVLSQGCLIMDFR